MFEFLKKILGLGNITNETNSEAVTDSSNLPEGEKPSEGIIERPRLRPITYAIVGSARSRPSQYNNFVSFTSRWSSVKSEELLKDVDIIGDAEPLVRMAIDKYTDSILNRGWFLEGKNPDAVSYVKKRLFEICLKSGVSFDALLRDVVRSVVLYSNAFIVVKRNSRDTDGKPYRLLGKRIEPIVGLYLVSPLDMELMTNKKGYPEKWRQVIDGKPIKQFDPDDVIHLYYARKPGSLLGAPFIRPIINTVKLKWLLEEMEVKQADNFAYPMIHVKIGNDNMPLAVDYESGSSEIDYYRNLFQKEEDAGFIVTDHRVSIEMITPNKITDFSKEIERYKQEIIAGLGLAPVLMGDSGSSNRTTAHVQENQFLDRVRTMQHEISSLLTYKLVMPLLWERTGKVDFSNVVEFKFREVDEERIIAVENHAANLFNMNVITLSEARARCGLLPLPEDDIYNTSYYLFPGKNAAAGPLVSNLDQPANQHGTQNAKPKYKQDTLPALDELVSTVKDSFDHTIHNIRMALEDGSFKTELLDTFKWLMYDEIKDKTRKFILKRVNEAFVDMAHNRQKDVAGLTEEQVEVLSSNMIETLCNLVDEFCDNLSDVITKESFEKQIVYLQSVSEVIESRIKYRIGVVSTNIYNDLCAFLG